MRRRERSSDLERIGWLFVTDDEEPAGLTLIARLELEARLYAGGNQV